jgi:hypothetical protein
MRQEIKIRGSSPLCSKTAHVYSPLPRRQLSISGALAPAAKEIVGWDRLGGRRTSSRRWAIRRVREKHSHSHSIPIPLNPPAHPPHLANVPLVQSRPPREVDDAVWLRHPCCNPFRIEIEKWASCCC